MDLTPLALLCPLVLPPTQTAAPGATADEVRAVVETVAASALEAEFAVGLSIAVALDDQLVHAGGYGLAELEHRVPVTTETLFRIGSITKQFAAAAVLELAEDFEVDVDADMREYLPDFDTRGHVVTVRHLLTHTSGIPSYTDQGPTWLRQVSLELSDAELLELVRDRPLDFAPGTAFHYNNTGYYLLGMLIEAASGKPWHEYLHDSFFVPLGLTRTRVGSNQDLIPGRAQGYQVVGDRLANDRLIGMNQPGAAGALLSTASDLVRWEIALRRGRVVQPESYEEMVTPYMLPDGSDAGYGMGLALREVDGVLSVQHGGGIFGFNSMLAHYPDAGLTVCVLSNSEALDSGAVEQRLAAALFHALGR